HKIRCEPSGCSQRPTHVEPRRQRAGDPVAGLLAELLVGTGPVDPFGAAWRSRPLVHAARLTAPMFGHSEGGPGGRLIFSGSPGGSPPSFSFSSGCASCFATVCAAVSITS